MKRLTTLFWSQWLAIRTSIALGVVFVVAAIPKLQAPPTFAKNLHAYGILPAELVNLASLTLPGIEMVMGLVLLLGIFRRPAALLSTALVVIFILAVAWNVIVGHPVSCSCFDMNAPVMTCAQMLTEMKLTIVRDLGLLLLALHVVLTANNPGWQPR